MPGSTHVRTAVAALSLTALGTLGTLGFLGFLGSPAAASAGDAPRTAAAAACPWNLGMPTAGDNPNTTTDYVADPAPVRKGPYGACDAVQTLSPGESVTVRCYVVNSYGNTWSYIPGSGWVWDAHLSGGGSPHICRF